MKIKETKIWRNQRGFSLGWAKDEQRRKKKPTFASQYKDRAFTWLRPRGRVQKTRKAS